MGIADLLDRLERLGGTPGTAAEIQTLRPKPLQRMAGMSGTSGTAEISDNAKDAPSPANFPRDDDRRSCCQCSNLTAGGRCMAAVHGELLASREYRPVRDLLRRCTGYRPIAGEPDQRTGRKRWPGLFNFTPEEQTK